MLKIIPILALGLWACAVTTDPDGEQTTQHSDAEQPTSLVSVQAVARAKYEYNPEGKTISERFPPPAGFVRTEVVPGSFGEYLRALPLAPDGSPVLSHDGRDLGKESSCAAVLDIDVGSRDLQQCADAVMRLRGEYLFGLKQYHDIGFSFLSDGKQRKYLDYAKGDYSHRKFRKYMNWIFAYANTSSLEGDVTPVQIKNMQPGDFFLHVRRGSYGHAVTVVDMADNPATGEKLFMIAQSYMPAQSIHILKSDSDQSPWYQLDFGSELRTPEWTFTDQHLRRF